MILSKSQQTTLNNLEIISPLWASKINKRLSHDDIYSIGNKTCRVNHHTLDLGVHRSCIVGEAYNFFSDYTNVQYCGNCEVFSMRLYEYIEYAHTSEDLQDWWKEVTKFVAHFKKRHRERYIAKLEAAIKKKELALTQQYLTSAATKIA